LCYINIHVDLLCDVAFLPNSLVPSLKTSEVEAPTSNGEEILNIKEFEIEWWYVFALKTQETDLF
jgi:hypothetical protein